MVYREWCHMKHWLSHDVDNDQSVSVEIDLNNKKENEEKQSGNFKWTKIARRKKSSWSDADIEKGHVAYLINDPGTI